MNDEIGKLLDEVIILELKELKTLDQDSSERQDAVNNVVKLYQIKNDEAKIHLDDIEKIVKRFDERIFGYLKLGVELIGIGAPLVFYAVWMGRGFKFEETGTFTSNTFKNLFNRFKPTK